MIRSILLIVSLLFIYGQVMADADSSKSIQFSLFADIYYSYDFAQPQKHLKPNFIYNHKRLDEVTANLLLAKWSFSDSVSRANFGLMAGTYAQYNLSHEPTWAQFVNEANMGFKVWKKRDLWLDVGILPSHIGFESSVSSECWTLTRSLVAESSPYYESGLRLSSTNTKSKTYWAFLVLNGWQNVQRYYGKQRPSFGLQFQKEFSSGLSVNYSNYVGSAGAHNEDALRVFHNFYLQFVDKSRLSLIAGFDIGYHNYNGPERYWYSPVVIVKKGLNKKMDVALRGEYFYDPSNVMIHTPVLGGFDVFGASANFDYQINDRMQWRIEGKMFSSPYKIFSDVLQKQNFSMTTNLTFRI